MRRMSLRTGLLFGAFFWTVGFFVATGIAFTAVMLRYPRMPGIFHTFFIHLPLSGFVAIVCMIAGLWYVRRGVSLVEQLRSRLTDVLGFGFAQYAEFDVVRRLDVEQPVLQHGYQLSAAACAAGNQRAAE